jgi:major membrane immunogen (membrane-anchored lipoprotein)
MRNNRYILFLFLFIISPHLCSAEKRALLIGISDYPKESGWIKINSVNDIELIKDALHVQKFSIKNIATLQDKQATKKGIVKAIEQLILKSEKGDIVFVHFSGHGQQIQDDNGDEIDGYDECLIPYDAFKKYNAQGYKGENHIRDDEFGFLMNKLRNKIGITGDLLIVLDACHSGSATRDAENTIFRGTDEIFTFPDFSPRSSIEGEDVLFYENFDAERGVSEKLSPVTIISASGKKEKNYEYRNKDGKYYGSLTYILSKVMHQNIGILSYTSFFDIVKNQMSLIAPRQTPQMEGAGNRLLLGGKSAETPVYYTIKEIVDNRKVVINAGQLSGLTDNINIEFYKSNQKRTAQNIVAKGKVSQSGIIESMVELDRPIDSKILLGCWAYTSGDSKTSQQERANLFRNVSTYNEKMNVNFEFVQKDNRKKEGMTFKEGEQFKIKIINKGEKRGYFQIIDIQSNNQISLLLPYAQRTPDEFYIEPNESRILPEVFGISKPWGIETFKLIVTENPINISRMIEDGETFSRSVIKNEAYFSSIHIYTATILVGDKND